MPLATIPEALDDIRQGKMVILVDDEDRENEGDLCMAAEMATAESINFMAKHGRGLICLSLAPDWVDRLRLPMMVRDNCARFQTAFTVSIEARQGVTTGISAGGLFGLLFGPRQSLWALFALNTLALALWESLAAQGVWLRSFSMTSPLAPSL